MFIYTYTFMLSVSQLINVSDDVYKKLTQFKGKQSYSEVIRGLFVEKTNKDKILGFFGKGGIDAKKVKELSPLWKKWLEKYV